MEINKSLSGGLNTDDAFEVIPPEDYISASNLAFGRSSKNKSGLGELMLGTRAIQSYVLKPSANDNFDTSLDGWTNKRVVNISGASSMSLSVSPATMIAGTIAAISGSTSFSLTPSGNLTPNAGYNIDVQIKGSSATAYPVRVYYDIGGGWVQLGTQNTLTTSYVLRGTINTVTHGTEIKIGITDASDVDLAFGASLSSSGSYVGFNGRTSFYTTPPITSVQTIYVRTYIVV